MLHHQAMAPSVTDESAAAHIALEGTARQRLELSARALLGLLKNPQDTRQVFVLNIAINRRHVPRFLTRFMIEPGGLELMRDQPAIDSHSVDFAALERLPADTLGHAYAKHLRDNGLDADLFQAPPELPRAIAYLAQRMRQSHDIWHVLTGYDTSVGGELALQAFTYAQTGAPGQLVLALVGTLRWSLRQPKLAADVLDGWRRGKRARSLLTVRWEDLWATPLAEVRQRLAIA